MRRLTKLFGIAMLLLMTSCFKKEAYDLVKGEELIQINIDSTTAVADGKSGVFVTATLSSKAIPSKRILVLKTNLGSFVEGKGDSIVLKADDRFTAKAFMGSTQTGKASITGTIAGYKNTSTAEVTFTKSYPSRISVSVDSFSVHNSYKSEVLITASLNSLNGGVASRGHEVAFSVVSANGANVGVFLNGRNTATTDVAGKATIRYSAGEAGITGRLTVVAQTLKADNSTASNTTYIYLIP